MRGIIRNTTFLKCTSQVCVLFLWIKCLRLLLKEYKYLIKGILTNNFVTNPLFLTDNIEHRPKSNKKYITFYIVFQVCKIQPLYFLVLDISSTDTIFHKFWTLHKQEKDFRHKFSFLIDSLTPLPHPLNSQNPLRPLLVESLVIVQRAHF